VSCDDAPTLRPQLRELVLDALAERLGGEGRALDPTAPVVRRDAQTVRRLAALEALVLEGARVLDLGAGLGDLARAARRLGAELVDAVEVDPGLLEVARLLYVLQQLDRISWLEGDAGLGSTYADEYDVVLACGPVLEAMRPILPRVAQNVRGVLLVELTSGDDAADDALADALPARAVLREAGGDGVALVACAADAGALRRHLASTAPAGAAAKKRRLLGKRAREGATTEASA
jgi:SAM-dependent methyltransferase